MLTSTQLFLLLTTDEGNVDGLGTQRDIGVRAAVIGDCLAAELVTLGPQKDPRVAVVPGASTADPVLAVALAHLGRKRKPPTFSSLVRDSQFTASAAIGTQLAQEGVVEQIPKKLLGLVPARYPVRDPHVERSIRERLAMVLAGQQSPTTADITICSIVAALRVEKRILGSEVPGLRGRALTKRVKEVGASSIEGSAVHRALQQLNTAIAAVGVSAAVAASSS